MLNVCKPNLVAGHLKFFFNTLINIFAISIKIMLQRIQSVYLLFVIICCIVQSMYSLFQVQAIDGIYNLSIIQTSLVSPISTSVLSFNYPLIIITALVIVLSAITIFSFRNRKMQMKIINLILLLVILLIGVLIWDYRQLISISDVKDVSYNYNLIFVPIIIVLLFLAKISIKKDEDLVRSSDRLR